MDSERGTGASTCTLTKAPVTVEVQGKKRGRPSSVKIKQTVV